MLRKIAEKVRGAREKVEAVRAKLEARREEAERKALEREVKRMRMYLGEQRTDIPAEALRRRYYALKRQEMATRMAAHRAARMELALKREQARARAAALAPLIPIAHREVDILGVRRRRRGRPRKSETLARMAAEEERNYWNNLLAPI
ncbi:MAG: hypothetical protein NZ954_08500 [Thermofilaceae archaeon]|nr:hypothetical protein [Thermofilaceae archaeon]MDW8005031.1 hypothetical protein [Thermofilaceae archaeon]